MIKNDTTLRYGLLVLGALFCIVSCTAEHGTAQLRDATKESTQNKRAEKLDAKAVILLDAELNPTIVTADGEEVPSCKQECQTISINDRVIRRNVRVEEIHAATVFKSRKNPCCITLILDNTPTEICYPC